MSDLEENVIGVKQEEEDNVIQKPKRKPKELSDEAREKMRANMEKARAALAQKTKAQKEEMKVKKEKLIIEKAEKLKTKTLKQDQKLKQILDVDDDVEVEEHIIKKPKVKKFIYREESDSEEEIIVKRPPKKVEAQPKQQPQTYAQPQMRINFC